MTELSEQHTVSSHEYERAVEIIREGGVVAFPTETYYGLAVDPFNKKALSWLFALKRRPPDKPVLTIIRDRGQLPLLAQNIPPAYEPLMRALWPGPLTLVFEAVSALPVILTGYTGTIGVRISSHPVAQALVEAVGHPITATSANLSGQPAAVTAQEVADQLGPDVDLVIDGGGTPGGMGSTIIGHQDDRLALLRPGVIPHKAIIGLANKP